MVLPIGFLRALLAAGLWALCADAQLLPGHSLTKIDALKLTVDWYMAGMVVPTETSIVLSPGIPQRLGALWSTSPLLTDNFDITLKLKGRKPAQRHTKEGGFALWYTPENGTNEQSVVFESHGHNAEQIQANTYGEAFKAAGLDLFGYKNKYSGLGVFFLDEEAGPSISAVANDGSSPKTLGAGIPASDATKVDFLNDQEQTVKISVTADTAKIELVGHPAITVKGSFKAGGYLGLTSFGGSKLTPQAEDKGPFFELKEMVVVNNDKNAKGEEIKATPPPVPVSPEDEKVDVMAEASSFKDHRAESDAIKDLTNMVFKLVVETQPIRHNMERALSVLAKRIDTMETNFNDLKAELDKKTGHKLGEEFAAIKQELSTLSNVASKETEERHTRLESLHKDIADVHQSANTDNIDKHLDRLMASNDKVLDQITNQHQSSFGVSLAAIGFIIISGLSLYNKFRSWEKKHVL